MSDPIVKEPEPKVPEPEPKEPTVDDKISVAIEAATQDIEGRFKNEIAGLNRRNTELEKELDDEKKAHMTDKQRLEYETGQREEKEKVLAERELALEKTQILSEMEVPHPFSRFINGADGNEIRVNAQEFTKVFNDEVDKGIQKKLAESGTKPPAGDEPAPGEYSQEDWDRLNAMPPGPEKDALETKMYESLTGMQI